MNNSRSRTRSSFSISISCRSPAATESGDHSIGAEELDSFPAADRRLEEGGGTVIDFESNCSTWTARLLLGLEFFTGDEGRWDVVGDERVIGIVVEWEESARI
ncbi:unnamed protein product [Nippostrongylus brasiliensis]|uniref:Uncharacterized protein n=1 Tax=Nippostrongylus brasiliensis TaxID=27835 RepID=A0A0N4YQL7_NIPBR|nr:unnamed protein product [Nippostrongylus brasiliensis]